ncbi:MAG TPA: tetratricopeptide repeat protein [Terriglobia bacterium]|nr:tetratricopeptide repeat protein [Terriglobia bacterium]
MRPREESKTAHGAIPTALGAMAGERTMFVFVFVCITAGVALGYILRGVVSSDTTAPGTQSVSVPTALNQEPADVFYSAVAPLEEALKADPQNTQLLIKLGNLYYDHQIYSKAIVYYERALQFVPRYVNVRTDLGTAYARSGFPKQAIAEYQQALAIAPEHFQTLFNLGVVYETGLKNPARAIAVWQKLLKLYPRTPDRDRIEKMIESAKLEEGSLATKQ